MSYIQLEIGGKLRGLKFNKLALNQMQVNINWEMYDATAKYGLIYGGLVGNNFVKQVENDFTFEDVCDWVDMMSDEDILKADACFKSTQMYRDLESKVEVLGKDAAEGLKKKLQTAIKKKRKLSTVT
jgi:hypothetical protein